MQFQKNGAIAGALALALVLVSAPVRSRAATEADTQLSRKEVKKLMEHTSSIEDYQKLSTYFERKAKRLEVKAREHAEEAEHSASSPGMQPKVPYPGGWVNHCRFLASEYSAEAKQAQAKADEYGAWAGGHGEGARLPQAVRSMPV